VTRKLSEMTEAQRAAYDLYHARNRKTDRPPLTILEPEERLEMAYLGHLDLWSKAAVGRAFGVTRTAVLRAMASYPLTMPHTSIRDDTGRHDG